MTPLVLHPVSQKQVSSFKKSPGHLLLVTGPAGSGKKALAKDIVSAVLGIGLDQVETNRYIRIIRAEKKSISIDSVRQLRQFLHLKTTGITSLRRAVIIEQANLLTTEAQNALLKTLEEPPADTVIILTSDHIQSLEPTIVSRAQILTLKKPQKDDLYDFFVANQKNRDKIDQAFRLSDGLPGLMSSILEEKREHPLFESVETAKRILNLNRFERLGQVHELSKDKDKSRDFIEALVRIAGASTSQAAEMDKGQNLDRWQKILSESIKAETALDLNGNARLVLTNLFLNI